MAAGASEIDGSYFGTSGVIRRGPKGARSSGAEVEHTPAMHSSTLATSLTFSLRRNSTTLGHPTAGHAPNGVHPVDGRHASKVVTIPKSRTVPILASHSSARFGACCARCV